MRIKDLNGKRVCILGFGKEGKAMFSAIEKHAKEAKMTVGDQNADALKELANPDRVTSLKSGYTIQSGSQWLHDIGSADVIIKSPGIPPNPELDALAAKTTSVTRIFLAEAKARGATVIGVTGSKGKSTTASLLHAMLVAGGKNSLLLGNIGKPSIDTVGELSDDTIVVLEMSSYQLMDLDESPPIAVITSFFPEHLDYHGSIDAYLEAKKRIARFQERDDAVFFAARSPGAVTIAAEGSGRKIPVEPDDAPVDLAETRLLGEHNRSNIALAWRVAEDLGVPREQAVAAIRAFTPLPHRLQSLSAHHGIEWIDDAISTTPQSAIAALDALGDRVRTVILGGQDRGTDFSQLADRIKRSNVRTVLLFPGTGPRIRDALASAQCSVAMFDAPDMPTAVCLAKERTPIETPPAICLLSTASPSYNMFKNFEEKGERFREEIEKS